VSVPRVAAASRNDNTLDILLVEDNLVNRRLALRLLARDGHRVVTAEDGAEAVAKFTARAFDLVLMDVQMPVMDGLEAAREIRRHEIAHSTIRTPIIALTANAMIGDREQCLASGMDDYLAKPIRPAELSTVIARYSTAPARTSV
jgi:CheY-like chemotaxis protein